MNTNPVDTLWDDRGVQRVRIRAWGRVHGVFFRVSCAERAEELRVSGWVRNVAGGGVEAVFEGDPAAVEQMVAWCREGPPSARVDRFEAVEEAPDGTQGFCITR